jgi:hypothetical protein
MQARRLIFLCSYNGGTVPLVPREILPQCWETDTKFKAVDLGKQAMREFVLSKVVNLSWRFLLIFEKTALIRLSSLLVELMGFTGS